MAGSVTGRSAMCEVRALHLVAEALSIVVQRFNRKQERFSRVYTPNDREIWDGELDFFLSPSFDSL